MLDNFAGGSRVNPCEGVKVEETRIAEPDVADAVVGLNIEAIACAAIEVKVGF